MVEIYTEYFLGSNYILAALSLFKMGLFKNKTTEEPEDITDKAVKTESNDINERPRICCIDLSPDVIDQLKQSKFNIYTGTLGNKIKVPNSSKGQSHQLLLDFDFPPNLHEYDIIILDLDNFKTVNYNAENHQRKSHTGKSAISLLSSYPETIFDPRPINSTILNKRLQQIGSRKHIIITFTTVTYNVEYESIKISEGYVDRLGTENHNIYDFSGYIPLSEPKFGKEISICNIREDLRIILEKNLSGTSYNQTFHHPTKWEGNQKIPDPNYTPLLKNSSDDIVSFCKFRDNSFLLCIPQLKDKASFLDDFLTKVAPDIMPEIFPFSTKFSWKRKAEYWLPNHENLIEDKANIKEEYEKKLQLKEKEISRNNLKYSFLHDILTETGDQLVDSLVKYFKWLGFKDVTKADEENTSSNVLEEDIQIKLEEGLLIIECKGIGGTSTDSDCSQISKIKHRRCKERNSFDVYALYLVNHQRYLPPLSRQNPPFTENQKHDAINDERGLLSTWQLFNLYYEIENGIIAKDKARKELLNYGYIEFKPPNLAFIDEPQELFKNGKICIVNISDVELQIGEEILVEKNGNFSKAIIEGIQVDGKIIANASKGEIGLQLSNPIKKNSTLWKKVGS